jgi:hypothetical protein
MNSEDGTDRFESLTLISLEQLNSTGSILNDYANYSNNLPLALEPIKHYLNTHRPSMPITLQLRKSLC